MPRSLGHSAARRTCTALVTAAVVMSTLAGTASAQSSNTTISAKSVVAAAKLAMAKQSGAHLLMESQASSSSSPELVVADLGTASGAETLSEGNQMLLIRVTPAHGYVRGNEAGLTKMLGLTSAEAKKLGNDWLSVDKGTSQYSDLANGLLMSSLSAVLPPSTGITLSTETTKTAKLYVIKWTVAQTSSSPKLSRTLTLTSAGTVLPVLETTTAAGGGVGSVAFSKWDEAVHESAPPSSDVINFTSLVPPSTTTTS
jgi:hypothetical protein